MGDNDLCFSVEYDYISPVILFGKKRSTSSSANQNEKSEVYKLYAVCVAFCTNQGLS